MDVLSFWVPLSLAAPPFGTQMIGVGKAAPAQFSAVSGGFLPRICFIMLIPNIDFNLPLILHQKCRQNWKILESTKQGSGTAKKTAPEKLTPHKEVSFRIYRWYYAEKLFRTKRGFYRSKAL